MAAQFVDALKGYEHFMAMRGKASIEDVNEFLDSIGRRTISQRTYEHYEKLLRRGFRSYIPINQFDVSRTIGNLQIAADRRRYFRESTQINASVSSDESHWIETTVIDKSLVGFGMATFEKFPIKPGGLIWIRLEHYRHIPAILVWKRRYENWIRFGVRALEFISNFLISEEEFVSARPTGILVVKRTSENGIAWREIFGIMEKIDELIDSSAELIYSIAEIANKKVKLAPPILLSIKFGSPGDVKVKIDLGIAEIGKFAVEKAQLWKLEKERYKTENRGKELENSLREVEVLRNAIRARNEAVDSGIGQNIADSIFFSIIMKTLNLDELPSPLFEPDSLESGILTDRLLPVATDLVAGDDPDIEVEIRESPSDEIEGE